MRCPKCKHEQKNAVECESCGLIFERYKQFQEKKKAQKASRAETAVENSFLAKALQLVLLIVVVATTTYYFTGYKSSGPEQVAAVESTVHNPAEKKEIKTQKITSRTVATADIREKKLQHNTIAMARNATVSIETPWGTGSGFFITRDFIVTNKHVVEVDEKQVAEFRGKVIKNRRLIDLEKQSIADLRRRLRQLPTGPSRSQLIIIIEDRVQQLERVIPEQERAEERLERLEDTIQPSSIKIILADGTEHVANYLLISAEHDLALMSLYGKDANFLKRSPDKNSLHQGETVFAIGSPVGLRHTVTSGIFSSYRRQGKDGPVFLQTDAAINPGNSGGPLIDENGYVWGVNTSIMRNTEGIGFAIPITTVYEEFGSSLY